MKQRVLSCIQPSGELHLGNYFGAISNWVSLQDQHDCFYGVVDLHVMTLPYKADVLRANTERMVIDLLACGIDMGKCRLFIQSLVPEHTELAWILGCCTSFGDLNKQPQFKEKREQAEKENKFISNGLFTYPVLQAADILIYRAPLVPVGRDQESHLELARNIVVRFNKQFGSLLTEPKPLFTDIPKLMSLADPSRKMSKSLGPEHYVGLFEGADSIRKKVKTAVTATSSGGEMSAGVRNLFAILKACGDEASHDELMKKEELGELQYSALKNAVTDALVDLTSKFIKRREMMDMNREGILQQVHESSAEVRKEAVRTLEKVRDAVGIPRSNVHAMQH